MRTPINPRFSLIRQYRGPISVGLPRIYCTCTRGVPQTFTRSPRPLALKNIPCVNQFCFLRMTRKATYRPRFSVVLPCIKVLVYVFRKTRRFVPHSVEFIYREILTVQLFVFINTARWLLIVLLRKTKKIRKNHGVNEN